MARPQDAGAPGEGCVDRDDQEIERLQRCAHLRLLSAVSEELLDDFREIDRSGRTVARSEDLADSSPRRLRDRKGNQRLRVEKRRHFSSSIRRSSSFSFANSSNADLPSYRCLNAPYARSIGSTGAGRSTSLSPWSSATSSLVFQRFRIGAGIETCPPLEMRSSILS